MPSPQASLAQSLEVPVSSVLEAAEIEVDRKRKGVMGLLSDGGITIAVVAGAAGQHAVRLGPADEIWCAGIVDLRADSEIQPRRLPGRLESSGLERPVLLVMARHEETVAPGPDPRPSSSRFTGVRLSMQLFLVELEPFGPVMLALEIVHRSEDGFGGHDVTGLKLRQEAGKTYLDGVRQDHLPASRSRCLKPDPYPLRYELRKHRFHRISTDPPLAPCGRY
jgi:hypothetical protein